MRNHQRRASSLALVAVGAAIATLLVVLPAQGAAKPQPPLDVRVTNTTAEPVPVAVQGTPTVKLDTTTPVPVRDADLPSRTAIIRGTTVAIAAGDRFGSATLYVVPAGKRLVIQAESAKSFLDAATATNLVAIFAQSSTAFVQQREYGYFTGQGYIWAGNATQLVYGEPGQPVSATIYLNAPATTGASAEVGFSGYLVDL